MRRVRMCHCSPHADLIWFVDSLEFAFMRLIALAAIAAATVLATPALAQNGLYGHAEVEFGFEPDPAYLDVVAGGDIDLSANSALNGGDPGCMGFVTAEPTFTMNYLAGNYPLGFFIESDADTTLMIKDPHGTTICADDTEIGDDGIIVYAYPETGLYSIWVGMFEPGTAPAVIEITENIDLGE